MSKFVYDPDAMKAWSRELMFILNGGPGSIKGYSMVFNRLMETLASPGIWTGAAANTNLQRFKEAHDALIKFTNSFGTAFATEMQSIAEKVEGLEINNLGADSDITDRFGSLDYESLSAAVEVNANQPYVTYDYAKIYELGRDLHDVKNTLEELKDRLIKKIEELASGRNIWEGDAAQNARETLVSTVNTNMPDVLVALDQCIKNIEGAAEAARSFDTGTPHVGAPSVTSSAQSSTSGPSVQSVSDISSSVVSTSSNDSQSISGN